MARHNENIKDDREENGSRENSFTGSRLVEGVRDWLLTNLKQSHLKQPWHKLSEVEQRSIANQVSERAETLVSDIVYHVVNGDLATITAQVDSFTVKGGEIKIVAKGMAENEVLTTLNSAGSKAVSITVINVEQFDQRRDDVKIDPDQPGLPGVKEFEEPGFDDSDREEPPAKDDANLFDDAVALVREHGEVSASFLQRNLAIGYNRASLIINELESAGVISTPNGANVRTVLPTEAQAAEAAEQIEGELALARAGKSAAWQDGLASYQAMLDLSSNTFSQGTVQFADFAAGWIFGEKSGAPRKTLDSVEVAPVVEGKPKRTRKPKVKDVEPEVVADPVQEESATEEDPTGGTGTVTDNNGADIESEDDAFDYGKWCRGDGRGTGSNPFPIASAYGRAWISGYSEAKRQELVNGDF